MTVDPDDAGADGGRGAVGEGQVPRPYARGEAVDRVVGVVYGRSASSNGITVTTGPKISS